MHRTRLAFVLLAGTGVLAFVVAAAAATPVLKGSVGPSFTIKLATKPTKAGKYTFVITDKASIHNFHLVGPGVNKKLTSIDGTGTSKPVTLTLKKGTYKYFCDLHPNLQGSFKIS